MDHNGVKAAIHSPLLRSNLVTMTPTTNKNEHTQSTRLPFPIPQPLLSQHCSLFFPFFPWKKTSRTTLLYTPDCPYTCSLPSCIGHRYSDSFAPHASSAPLGHLSLISPSLVYLADRFILFSFSSRQETTRTTIQYTPVRIRPTSPASGTIYTNSVPLPHRATTLVTLTA